MENQSILSHVSVGTNDYEKAIIFYDKIFLPLGIKKLMEHGEATVYGKQFPEFWVQTPHDGEKAVPSNGIHISFLLSSPEEVDQFYTLSMEAGATNDGEPGPREMYSPAYYGAFIRDLDGNKIEAMYWDETKA